MESFNYQLRPGKQQPPPYDLHKVVQQKPLISIITPFYNAAPYFEQAFQCIHAQTFPWFEWIIVDDGSTDEPSLQLLDSLPQREPRAKVFHKKNEGPAAARNFAAKQASTEYLMFMDADDLWEPTILEYLYLMLESEPEASWAYPDTVTIGAAEFLWNPHFSSNQMKVENQLVISSMIRKTAFLSVGGFDVMGRYYNEDWHLWLKLLAAGMRPAHVCQFLFWYRNEKRGALAALQNDAEQTKRNQRKIQEIAAQIPDNVFAIEHPYEKSSPLTGLHCWQSLRKLPFSEKKHHILMILPHMVMGGADRFNLDWIEHLDKSRYSVTIVTTLPSTNQWLQKFAQLTDDIFVLPGFLDMAHWPAFLDYLVDTRQIDLLFNTNSYYGYMALPWLCTRWPHLACIDYIHAVEWGYRNGGYARASCVVSPLLDATYVCNEYTRQEMISQLGGTADKIKTAYIGVDTSLFSPRTPKALPNKQAGCKPIVFYPCRIVAEKRPFLMLEIAKRLPEMQFVVAGDGPLLAPIKEKAAAESLTERIVFIGEQPDLRPWYEKAAVTLICSLREGLALTAYESLSMETPVVSCDSGGQLELIDPTVGRIIKIKQSLDSENTFEVDLQEAQEYAQALRQIVFCEDYIEMSKNCRQKILERFAVNQTLQPIFDAMEDFCKPAATEQRIQQRLRQASLLPVLQAQLELYSDYETSASKFAELSNKYSQSINELARIQSMRSYQFTERYRLFMQKPFWAWLRKLILRR